MKTLLINAHPNKESYCYALANAYKKGALQAHAEIDEINLADLQFNPNLAFGYKKRTELEPDLLLAWKKITEADHIVWIYPVWWGSYPAIMKGFIDRLFLPGLAFKYRENSVWWDKLLKGKSARIICTLDQPPWYYLFINRRPSYWAFKKMTLNFCGIAPVKTTTIGPVKNAKPEKREIWLKKVEKIGFSDQKSR